MTSSRHRVRSCQGCSGHSALLKHASHPSWFAVDCVHSHPPIRRCCSISLARLRGTTLRPAKGRATERLLRRQPLQTLLRWTVQGFSSFPDRPPGLQPTSLTTAVPRTRFSMLQQRLGEAHSPQSPAPDRSARSSYIHDADASSWRLRHHRGEVCSSPGRTHQAGVVNGRSFGMDPQEVLWRGIMMPPHRRGQPNCNR